jgi:membrane protease YdiL (CAAX protease family)
VINLGPVPDAAYVPATLALAGALLALARRGRLPAEWLGLARSGLRRGVAVELVAMAVVGAVIASAWALPATRPLLADERVAHLGTAGVAYWALVRIPVGTAVAEELVFRSVLLAAIAARRGWRAGMVGSSVVFGLWHVGPSVVALRANSLGEDPLWPGAGVVGAVAVTVVGGLLFSALRWWGGHVIAPVLGHVITNVFSLLAAVAVLTAG